MSSIAVVSPGVVGISQSKLGSFLGHHYGDGMVYLTGRRDRVLLREAMARGLVSDDGYLTNRGYRFWRRHGQ